MTAFAQRLALHNSEAELEALKAEGRGMVWANERAVQSKQPIPFGEMQFTLLGFAHPRNEGRSRRRNPVGENSMSEQKFDSWGLVELFGHQRVVGRITEQSVGGCNFVRVDVLQADGSFYTRLFGSGAIYALNITSEEVARALAQRMEQKPVFAYELQQAQPQPRIAAPQTFSADDSDDDDDTDADDERDDEFEDEEQRW